MNRDEALEVLGLGQAFTPDDIKSAYLEKTKSAHKCGKSEEMQQALNVARDVLIGELSTATALVPTLTRELAKIGTQQELIAKRQSAKDDLTESIAAESRKTKGRLHSTRDISGILAALAGGAGFLRENLAEITQVQLPASSSAFLLIACAYLMICAFIANHAAKRVEERTTELNRVLLRQRTIDRVLSHAFADSENLSEDAFEASVAEAIEIETGVSQDLDGRHRNQTSTFSGRRVGHGVFEDYIDFLITSERVDTHGTSGRDLTISRNLS